MQATHFAIPCRDRSTPMDKQQLQSALTELHQELSTTHDVEGSTKAMLVTLMQDIAKLLAGESISSGSLAGESLAGESLAGEAASAAGQNSESEPSLDDQPPSTGSESLRALVVEFETEHPKIARTLGQLADGLANLGI